MDTQSLKNKVVTVFGGSGFLGRYVVQRLSHLGAYVRVASRDPGFANVNRTSGFVGQVTPVRCDVRDASLVEAAISGSDVVINLVGILFERGKKNFQKIHVDGAKNIADACKKLKVERLIHVSALSVDSNPSSYAKTKHEAELYVKKTVPNVTIIRPSLMVGSDDQFFNKFACMSVFSPILPITGGNTKFQPVFVDDVAKAIIASLVDRHAIGQVYDLGGPKVYSFKELMELQNSYTKRSACIWDMPNGLAKFLAFFLQLLPKPLLTIDQVRSLSVDNIVSKKSLGFKELGITPQPIEAIIAQYLPRYKKAS